MSRTLSSSVRTVPVSDGVDRVEARARRSLERLGLPRADLLLVSSAGDLAGAEGRALWDRLLALKDRGLYRRIGFCATIEDGPALLARRFQPDVVQLGCNLLDQRAQHTGILAELAALEVERVAVVAPYPQFVVDAGAAYLQAAGLDIVAKHRVVTRTSDTRTIYELGSDDALAAVRELDLGRAQCVLFTGTGMPSLRAIDTLAQSCDLPVLSTSLCMAWALAKRVQLELPPGPHPLLNGWQSRIGQL